MSCSPRSRSLRETRAIAAEAARRASITRVADLTGLDRAGLPVFQAIRPHARSLSVAQGKGLTATAAWISAVMESLEHYAAEQLPRPLGNHPTVAAVDLLSGQPMRVAWRDISLDTVDAQPHAFGRTIGLGAGNDRSEAMEAAVAEVLEREFEWCWRMGTARDRLSTQIALDSLEAGVVRQLIAHLERRELSIRLWSVGQQHGVAAIIAIVSELGTAGDVLPPALGSGCSPDRAIAAVQAITEALQARAMLIAGARDDLSVRDYGNGADRTFQALLWSAGLGAGRLEWRKVPHCPIQSAAESLDRLLSVGAALDRGALACLDLPSPDPRLSIVKVFAPYYRHVEDHKLRSVKFLPPRRRPQGGGAVVYVGPTWPDAALPMGFERRPPACAGDLATLLVQGPPAAVGLIDGVFEQAPSVWHKEILDLLGHGVAVFGSASLGALRAAELDCYGMIGVGQVFEAYRDGRVVRDDAVMVTHAPAELGFRPLTLALVDAEAALDVLPLDGCDRRMLQRAARTLSFRQRTWESCVAAVEHRSGCRRNDLRTLLTPPPRSVKLVDAKRLVAVMARWLASPVPPRCEPVPMTAQYRALLSVVGQGPASNSRATTIAPLRRAAAGTE